MEIHICADKQELGRQAARTGAELLRAAIARQGQAAIIVATGASQFEMLAELVQAPDIDWTRVTGFHLDEYVGMSDTHGASFRKYLRERFVSKVTLAEFHYVSGEGDPAANCRALGEAIRRHPIDVAFVGIGENGHLAFNDPPADFETDEPYIVVKLDDACRRQQLGEGWFKSFDEVPTHAISMSIRQIMLSRAIICTVPDRRKAVAVAGAAEGPVTPMLPSSILQQHGLTHLFLDNDSASLLRGRDHA